MASVARHGRNEPEPKPIIVKKIIVNAHAAHHGGQWKVAYADFVTAMMAFFMLMWLLNATDEKKRKGLAEYFTPSVVEMKPKSAGSDGILNGNALQAKDNFPSRASQSNAAAIQLSKQITSGAREDEKFRARDRARFEQLKKVLLDRMDRTPDLRDLKTHIRFSIAPEGMRIDLVDEADFSMFRIATDRLLPQARKLVNEVAVVIGTVPNEIIVRGHTDALPYSRGQTMNNWTLSTARAEATRAALADNGIAVERFARIEGVAEREPFARENLYDPRNRRMSITLMWSKDEASNAALKSLGR